VEEDSTGSVTGVPNKKEKKPKVWHPQQEVVLKQWAEIATSFRWLHHQAHIRFSKASFWVTLPVIILSSVTGTMNFAQSSFPPEYVDYVPLFIGTLNLVAGAMTTVQSYLRLSELAEGHRVASQMFGKLSRNIRVELMLPMTERTMDGDDYIAMCRSELDRLTEQSPDIPKHIEQKFMKKFADLLQTDFYPPELLQLHPVEVYHSTEAEGMPVPPLVLDPAAATTATVVANAALQFQRQLEKARESREALNPIPEHVPPSPPLVPVLPSAEVAQELTTLSRLQAVTSLLRRNMAAAPPPLPPPPLLQLPSVAAAVVLPDPVFGNAAVEEMPGQGALDMV
jgi:hypothetical protein